MPVTVSIVPVGDAALKLIPEVIVEALDTPRFLRASASPFLDEKTRTTLGPHDRKTLVIAGFATEVVVLHAVTAAVEAGDPALVPVDACSGLSARAEAAALRQIEAFGAEVTSTVTLATALGADFTTPQGKQMFAVIRGNRCDQRIDIGAKQYMPYATINPATGQQSAAFAEHTPSAIGQALQQAEKAYHSWGRKVSRKAPRC